MRIEVRLFATLRRYLPPASQHAIVLEVPEHTRLSTIIEQLEIPRELAQLILVDGVHEPDRERVLSDGAVLSIFPPVAGGSNN